VFELIEAPNKLVYTWALEGLAGDPERVTVQFTAQGATTEVTVTHEGIPSAPGRDRHEQGWLGCLDGLLKYLQTSSTARD
jgi:uncharacterized protein YndB with AHSA1/START domain